MVCLVAVLVTIAINRIWRLRVEAERVAVAQVVGAIRSAVGIEVARRVLREGVDSIAQLDGGNPMDLLAQLPPGYRGALVNPDPGQLVPGDWYYDERERVLVYRVRFPEAFDSAQHQMRAVYRLTLKFDDRNRDGRFNRGSDTIYGLDLLPVGEFRWIEPPRSWWESGL